MNTTIGRNDPCVCGSGKKYKKCCGVKETVSINSLIENEVLNLQAQIIDYAITNYDIELEQDFEEILLDIVTEDESELEFYSFAHSVWFTLFGQVRNGKTILEQYINERSHLIQRPKVREIVQSWTRVRPITGRVVVTTETHISLKETFSDQIIEIKYPDSSDVDINSFVFAMIVPLGEEWIPFPTVFDLVSNEYNEDEENALKREFEISGYEDIDEFLKENFVSLMNELQFVSMDYSANGFEWQKQSHKEIANLFEKEMIKEGAPSTFVATGVLLWLKFCEEQPTHRKSPESYAAAMHYITHSLNPVFSVTKKELAEIYGITPSTLTNAQREIEGEISEEISKFRAEILKDFLEDIKMKTLRSNDAFSFDDIYEKVFEDEDSEDGFDDDNLFIVEPPAKTKAKVLPFKKK